jgi:energy-coupling factor transporter ATP-binding protein EcfA2
MKNDDRAVQITDIGPIRHLDVPLRPGRITVLRGANGSGKSTALAAVHAVAAGEKGKRPRLEQRDSCHSGEVAGLGVRITVGRNGANRRTELDDRLAVLDMEDRLSIADLVDPGLKDQAAADARRIRALVSLAGEPVTPAAFEGIFDSRDSFDRFVSPETRKRDDLVEMASAIKRDCDRAALAEERRAENAENEADSLDRQNSGVDMIVEHDETILRSRYESAMRSAIALEQRTRAIDEQRTRHAESSEKLAAIVGGRDLESEVERAQAEADEAAIASDDRRSLVDDLERELARAKAAAELAESKAVAARKRLAEIERERSTVADLLAVVESAVPEPVDPAEVDAARAALDAAERAQAEGVRVREAMLRDRKAADKRSEAGRLRSLALSLRDAGKRTEGVLSRIVAKMGTAFSVDSFLRLRVVHTLRGETYFAELSDGERWKLALDVAIAAFAREGRPGVLVIPQDAWESLDGANREAISTHIAGTDLSIITAEADDDPETDASAGVSVDEFDDGRPRPARRGGR